MGEIGALVFLVLGLALSPGVAALVARLSRPEAPPEDTERGERRPLPWQSEPGSGWLRLGVAGMTPLLTAVAGWRFEAPQAVAVSALLLALLVCTATDLLRYRVPNAVTYPGVVLALLAGALMPGGDAVDAFLAALAAGGVFLFMAILTRGGMGLGDVKLAVLIGAALGLQAGYLALVSGVVLGGVMIFVLFAAGLVGRKQALPYAPFLTLAAMAVVLTRGAAFAPL